jgi:acetyl-CoA carboxylase carboxyltransferase component
MFPGRRGAGRIFYNQVQMSGQLPQVCLLFGPSAAGGAYIPAFCDVVAMVDGNASMYLGSPRMAEMVIGEKVTLEEMGGAKMHCSVSGCGDVLCKTEDDAIAFCKRYLAYMPESFEAAPPSVEPRAPRSSGKRIEEIVPADENKAFDMMAVIGEIVDEGSWLEIKALFAREMLTGFARIDGRAIGIVANQPKWLGGVLFVDSADKAARFIWLCDAFNIPILYLADVPGFMIGTKVERQGIIRAGAKMIAAVSEATVPKVSVVVRKAYGAGLYAMCGPAFEPDACIALPSASIAVMGPQAAVNAVYFNKIQEVPEGPEREAYVKKLRDEYRADIDLMKLASELVIDAVVPGDRLRAEVSSRFARAADKREARAEKKHLVPPV